MTTLYLDCGNTRIKSRLGNGVVQSLDYDAFATGLPALVANAAVSKIVLASVHGEGRRAVFVNLLRQAFAGPILNCVVTEQAVGVRCAYDDLSRLGIDRWLAVVAAWNLWPGACLVVDLGTAATLDCVDAAGAHLGGYIVCGLELSVRSLLAGTENIRPDQSGFAEVGLAPGRSTAEAVYHGALLGLVALIETSYQNLIKTCPQAKLILAGGDAALVGSHLTSSYVHSTDLVFEGMRLLENALLLVDA